MVQPREMRASDTDRERIAAILRDAHADGRLAQDELMERVESTYSARTYQDLDMVVADLPLPETQRQVARTRSRPVSAPTATRPIRQKMRRAARTTLNAGWWCWTAAVAVNLVIWLIIAVTTVDPPYFWPIWVAGPWGVVLLMSELAFRRNHDKKAQ